MASTTGDMRGGYDASTSTMLVSQSGWVVFAALMLLFSGIWIAVEGIIAFFRSAWYIGNPVFGSLWLWSIAWLGFGVLLVAAGTAVMSGQRSEERRVGKECRS